MKHEGAYFLPVSASQRGQFIPQGSTFLGIFLITARIPAGLFKGLLKEASKGGDLGDILVYMLAVV